MYLALSFFIVACSDRKDLAKKNRLSEKDLAYFEAIKVNDEALPEPLYGQWRYHHHEQKQSFDDYISEHPFIPNSEQSVIYLQPLGEFTSLQMKAIGLTRDYLEIFFQRKTVVLPPVSDAYIPSNARRENSGHEQLLTGHILKKMLLPSVPDDAMALMAISEKDLYPAENWNYVFGQASYKDRIGVSSVYRLQDEYLSQSNFKICLKRLINVSSHEIGHMLSVKHCQFAKCVMNGSNNMDETDDSPNRLCSDCQKKFTWNLGYDNKKRLERLVAFTQSNGLDAALLAKDMNTFPN